MRDRMRVEGVTAVVEVVHREGELTKPTSRSRTSQSSTTTSRGCDVETVTRGYTIEPDADGNRWAHFECCDCCWSEAFQADPPQYGYCLVCENEVLRLDLMIGAAERDNRDSVALARRLARQHERDRGEDDAG